jgi:hypothetical protein
MDEDGMTKRPKLTANPPAVETQFAFIEANDKPIPKKKTLERRYPVASTREGKRVVTSYFEEAAWIQLHVIALKEGKTIQELMTEGLNTIFERRQMGRIA